MSAQNKYLTLDQTVSVRRVELEVDECHDRKCEEGASAIAEIRQRNPYGREKSHHHAQIDREMHKQDRGKAIAENTVKCGFLTFCEIVNPPDKQCVENDEHGGAEKAPLFADGTKNIVGFLFWNEFTARYRAFHIAFAEKAAGSNRGFRIQQVVTRSIAECFLAFIQNFDTFTLVFRK